VFLHHRDFAERHKPPEVDDVIEFSLGTDRQGRGCATHAVHRNDGGRIRGRDLAVLLLLLVAPGWASWQFAVTWNGRALLGWCPLASAVTYFLYADDKRRARHGTWRAPESTLHFFELVGGWPGAFLAQRRLRHKVSKRSFQLVFWFIVLAHQFVAVDYLLGWRMSRAALAAMQ
jgi:uncharacterized membrane protein YsdA (DUF1294 family)